MRLAARQVFNRHLASMACISVVLCVMFVSATAQAYSSCLVTAAAESANKLRYSLRKDRCEGVLPRYVGHGDGIELIGYGAGSISTATPTAEVVVPEAKARPDPLTFRALSLTARKRYQMDMSLAGDGKYRWSLELLRAAQTNQDVLLDPATIGAVACTNRCASRPDTVYFPVFLDAAASGTRPPLSLKLRSDVIATNVRASLRPYAGGPAIEPNLGRLELYPDELVIVPLPAGLQPGEYRLEVRATNSHTRQQMSSLLARIIVP